MDGEIFYIEYFVTDAHFNGVGIIRRNVIYANGALECTNLVRGNFLFGDDGLFFRPVTVLVAHQRNGDFFRNFFGVAIFDHAPEVYGVGGAVNGLIGVEIAPVGFDTFNVRQGVAVAVIAQ